MRGDDADSIGRARTLSAGGDLAPGVVVDGRYRLVGPLGEGTFGTVWRAEDARLVGRSVAIKFLKGEFLTHVEAAARFEAEADALVQVQHPNVVAVVDRGRWGSARYLVTELVEGRPLTAWIEEFRARGAFPPLNAVRALFDQVCAGIAAAHAARAPGAIVHRDVKPDNILVRSLPEGEVLVKILDFGIAQLGQRTGTRTGAMMGTPLYMAPEQAMGNSAAVAPCTDVFALGVVLVEMLTLRAQVDQNSPWWGTAIQRSAEVRALLGGLRADVPPAVWDLVTQTLRAHGPERPPDAGSLRSALRAAWASGDVVSARPSIQPTLPVLALPHAPAGLPAPVHHKTVLSVPPPSSQQTTTAPFELVSRASAAPTKFPLAAGVGAGVGLLVVGVVAAVVWSPSAGRHPATTVLAAPAVRTVEGASAAVLVAATPPAVLERLFPSTVLASSYRGGNRDEHAPWHAFDGRADTAWSESSGGVGRGGWIEARFNTPVVVNSLRLTTGWDHVDRRRADLFTQRSHLRRVRVVFDGGAEVVRDVGFGQRELLIADLAQPTRSVRVEALDVYPGSRASTLALSEVMLSGQHVASP